MRVCLLSPELPPYLFGGIGQYVLTLAKELDRLGHEVTVAGFQIHPQREIRHSWGRSLSISGLLDGAPKLVTACARGMEQFVDRADPIVNLQNVPFLWRLGHAWSLRQILDGAIAVRRYLKDTAGRFDVVELPNYPGHGALLPAIASPYVVRLSTPAAECGSSTNFYVTALERRACHSARHVIADSDTMRSKAEEIYRIQPSKLSVIHHGLDDVLMDTRGPAGGRLVFTYCGRAEARKGTDILIRALGRLLPTQPDVLIRFIGADVDAFVSSHRELSQAWSELKARHGHQIDQVGTVSEDTRDSFLAASDWTIIPSRSESFGLVAVESMRVGTPVIAAAVGGLAEVCGMCPENVLYEPHSVLDLESALRRACDAGRGSMPVRRQAARATYLSHFTASRMVESTLEVYRSVCD